MTIEQPLDDRYTYAPKVMAAIRQQFNQFKYDPWKITNWRRYELKQQTTRQKQRQQDYQAYEQTVDKQYQDRQQITEAINNERINESRQAIEEAVEIQQAVGQQARQAEQKKEEQVRYEETAKVEQSRKQQAEVETPAEQEQRLEELRRQQRQDVKEDPDNQNKRKSWVGGLLKQVKRLSKELLEPDTILQDSNLLMVVSESDSSSSLNDITQDNPAFYSMDGSNSADLIISRLNNGQLAVLTPNREMLASPIFWEQTLALLDTLGVSQCDRLGHHLTAAQMPTPKTPPKDTSDSLSQAQPNPSAPAQEDEKEELAEEEMPNPTAPLQDETDERHVMPEPSAPSMDETIEQQEYRFLASAPIMEEVFSYSPIELSSQARHDLYDMQQSFNDLSDARRQNPSMPRPGQDNSGDPE